MRDAGSSVRRYVAGIVPQSPNELAAFLREELAKLQATLQGLADGQLDATTVAPGKPRDGMLRRADGTLWNPGGGAGVYCFYGSVWHFLG